MMKSKNVSSHHTQARAHNLYMYADDNKEILHHMKINLCFIESRLKESPRSPFPHMWDVFYCSQ